MENSIMSVAPAKAAKSKRIVFFVPEIGFRAAYSVVRQHFLRVHVYVFMMVMLLVPMAQKASEIICVAPS